MKKIKLVYSLLIILVISSCSKSNTENPKIPSPSFEYAYNIVTAIPDANAISVGVAETIINIDKDEIIADGSKITIELDLTHSYISDLAIELIAPSGESLGIIKRIATTTTTINTGIGVFVLGNKLDFNSTFTTEISSAVFNNIPQGSYKATFGKNITPAEVVEKPFDDFFKNKRIKGIWKLRVYDCINMDTGALNAWKIKFDAGALQ